MVVTFNTFPFADYTLNVTGKLLVATVWDGLESYVNASIQYFTVPHLWNRILCQKIWKMRPTSCSREDPVLLCSVGTRVGVCKYMYTIKWLNLSPIVFLPFIQKLQRTGQFQLFIHLLIYYSILAFNIFYAFGLVALIWKCIVCSRGGEKQVILFSVLPFNSPIKSNKDK